MGFLRSQSSSVSGRALAHLFQSMARAVLIAMAIAATGATLLAAFGQIPWLFIDLQTTNGPVANSAPYAQIGVTALLISLCAFLPGVNRMLTLERSHRKFDMTMEDVAGAYRIAHEADREGAFALSSEFDSVRERLKYLRQHPDLGRLEPEIMELAAQMSHTTRDLAKIYSDEHVERAKSFLKQRQTELDEFEEKIALALTVTEQIKHWQRDVEASEREADRQIDRLEKDLREILPTLGYELDEEEADNVVPMSGKTPPPGHDRTN